MLAIRYVKSIPRYLMVRSLAPYWQDVSTGALSCIELAEIPVPALPNAEWVRISPRLSGICGSDLSTIQAQGSPYLSPFVSCPFVFGHEIVGTVAEIGAKVTGIALGDRVVIEPALSCRIRGIEPTCRQCQQENYGTCENLTQGHIAPGLQTGYCQSTGGGWSSALVAHQLQIYPVPETLSDEEAVLMEPFSCAIHAVLKVMPTAPQTVLVIGCGLIGLLTIAALRSLGFEGKLLVIAKYPHQAELAKTLGADQIFPTDKLLYTQLRQALDCQIFYPELGKPVLTGGADCSFDCVASSTSIDDALRFTRSQGNVILVGMPSIPQGIDWTAIWFKELHIRGSYAYGLETYQGAKMRTFDLAIKIIQQQSGLLSRLVTGHYPLQKYQTALHAAMNPGKSKAIKTVFDLRNQE
ncbi:alcohol dehydrogenase catalytic domain-containing protein [Microcoleus sp. D2_18a_D3]|uniref:alcohol dehydrogenase catalytic domain-containing protein n=1 Tax=Microcoleus sp. D2_18a_D3 TaxID=3055330 RepID=UPI002FD4919B